MKIELTQTKLTYKKPFNTFKVFCGKYVGHVTHVVFALIIPKASLCI